MSRTQLTGSQIYDGTVTRADLDAVTPGQSVIKKLIAGNGINITSTGADSGTGDVTINLISTGIYTSKEYVDAQDTILSNKIDTKSSIDNVSIYTVNAATRLIQTQSILANLVLTGQLK